MGLNKITTDLETPKKIVFAFFLVQHSITPILHHSISWYSVTLLLFHAAFDKAEQ